MKKKDIISFIVAAIVFITTAFGISSCHRTNSSKDVYNILVIHSSDSLYPAGKDIRNGIIEAFEKNNIPVEIDHFYLNCKLLDTRQELDTLTKLLDRYTDNPPHIILTENNQAIFSLIGCNHPITHTVPIIFSGVNYPNYEKPTGYDNISGFKCKPDFIACYKLAQNIIPHITRINVLTDSSFWGQISQKEFLRQWESADLKEKTGVTIRFIPYREMKTSRVLYPFYNASKGDIFILPKWDFTISQFSNISTQPFLTTCNENIGHNINSGILGGFFTLPYQQGFDGANLAAQIVKGTKKINNIPLQYHKALPVFDWTQLKRLNIAKSKLPGNSYIYNMPIYEKYKTEFIILSLAASILLLFLILLYVLEKNKKKLFQSKLQSKQELLEQALQIGNFHTWSYDLSTKELSFDKGFFENTGLPIPGSYKMKRIALLRKIHPDDRQSFYKTLSTAIHARNKKVIAQFRIAFNHPDRYEWWETHFSLSPHIFQSNAQIYGLCFSIEHLKQREMKLVTARDSTAKAELRQSFVANISHETQAPLQAIIQFANLLSDENKFSPEERKSFIRAINRNCEILLKLINDVSELSKLDADTTPLTSEACDMNQIVKLVYSRYKTTVPKTIRFSLDIPQKTVILKSDTIRLILLLSNMLENAIKFTKEGCITIGYNIEKREYLTLFVKDTGIGIPEEKQKLIFDRFYKCDSSTQGPGLGLSVCAAIAKLLEANIQVKSEPGKGSCFAVYIPMRENIKITIDEDTEISPQYSSNFISWSKDEEG